MKTYSVMITLGCLIAAQGCSTTVGRHDQKAESSSCSLDEEQLAQRKVVLAELTHGVTARKEFPEGVAYRFDAGGGIILRLARLLELESDCCQFLTFKIIAESSNRAVWLEISGPAESKKLIHEYFDSN